MNNTFRKAVALFGAVTMLASAMAVNASAQNNIVSNIIRKSAAPVLEETAPVVGSWFCTDGQYYYSSTGTAETTAPAVSSKENSVILNNIYRASASDMSQKYDQFAIPDSVYKNGVYTTSTLNYSVILGGKYYYNADVEIQEYFKLNTYTINMKVGEEKLLSPDAMFYTQDGSVVGIDTKTGSLIAKGVGSTYVYAYTQEGLPFLRIAVNVGNVSSVTTKLDLCADKWHLTTLGASTGFTLKCPKQYNDIVFDIVYGRNNASFVNGCLVAKAYGPVVVRAYSRSNPLICGETIVYVGKYQAPVYDGYWYAHGNDIRVNECPFNIWNTNNSYINGWIKTDEGILVPVVKIQNAEVIRNGETIATTIIAAGGSITLEELLKERYCDNDIIGISKFYYDGIYYPIIDDLEDDKNCGAKPDYKPDCKPDYKPDVKPDKKPDQKPVKPDNDCDGKPVRPVVKPGTGHGKPDVKPGTDCKPVVKPETDCSKPSGKNDHLDIQTALLYFSQILKSAGESAE